jgi:hypothetical protein
MRARTALALASLALLPAALPAPPDAGLADHALPVDAQMRLLLRIVALQGDARPSPLGAPPALPLPLPDGARHVLVHVVSGERAWAQWLPSGQGEPLDLDGDGAPELRATADAEPLQLRVAGLAPAARPWVLWVEQGPAKWGLTGQGLAPANASARLLAGMLRLEAEGGSAGWHAGFAEANGALRGLAWLLDGQEGSALRAEVGQGFLVRTRTPGFAARLLLLEGDATSDVTVRGLPAEATLLLGEDGALRYRARAGGGGLRFDGPASPIGQRGELDFRAQPLPSDFTLQPSGDGFQFDASRPTDFDLAWQPPGAPPVHMAGSDVDSLGAQPKGHGMAVHGKGRVAVSQPRPGQPEEVHVVDLSEAQAASLPLDPAAGSVALLGIVGVAAWALRPALRRVRSGRRA